MLYKDYAPIVFVEIEPASRKSWKVNHQIRLVLETVTNFIAKKK